ncbi:MAG: DJ-1/PfpI family protein [Bacteroidaceae bacterium]|nr:DJ-1/PfpI family protein [Bacteroidaceae bacterium]
MKKSYLFLADGFEEIEALTVVDVLRRAEMPLVTLSVTDKAVVTGAHGIPVVADALAQDIAFDDVEWLILPGGMPGMTNLAASRPLCNLIKAHAEAGGLTAAICASPSILGMLGLLNGRRATCYPGFEHNLEGAIVTGERCSVDENITTANGPASATAFALSLIAQSCGEEKAQEVAAGMLV